VSAGRILDEPALVEALAAEREAGRRIVLTNGAFDLLHVGHLRVLAAAAALGDVLVAAVNDDASVRILRGRERPLIPAAERVALVAAVRHVDYALVFPDTTMDRLLEVLRPDVHAKGTDYHLETLPERETNERLGIEMAFVGGPKDHSTTSLLGRAAAASDSADQFRRYYEGDVQGFIDRYARRFLDDHGWLDIERLVTTDEGRIVEGTERRWVRRIEIAGTALYVKVTYPLDRKRNPIEEARNNVMLRAAGFRAPAPWLALRGPVRGRHAGIYVAREALGVPLDDWLTEHLPRCGIRERYRIARGIGLTVRALHAARFLFPDLQAWHLLVDGSPAGGRASLILLDLMRMERSSKDVTAATAAPGLAALALSLRPVTDARFRLAILRAYRGGTLLRGPQYLDAIEKRIAKIKDRGTFRHLTEEA
jgi:rfaE bifunctional protein nucleotidyltransferase chain/domain